MRSFLRLATCAATLLIAGWFVPGCSSHEGGAGKMEGGAMDGGKMSGAMDKGQMSGAMDKGKMEGAAKDEGKMEGTSK
jgi:hypothetical protein